MWRARVVAYVCLPAIFVGCSTSAASTSISPDDAAFRGLDSAVVREVIDNPGAQKRAANTSDEEWRRSLWQGMARNFVECRAAANAYEQWTTTGVVPTLPPATRPEQPLEPSNRDLAAFRTSVASALSGGDPEVLRGLITGEGRCGEWIPMKSGDVSGPSISKALGP